MLCCSPRLFCHIFCLYCVKIKLSVYVGESFSYPVGNYELSIAYIWATKIFAIFVCFSLSWVPPPPPSMLSFSLFLSLSFSLYFSLSLSLPFGLRFPISLFSSVFSCGFLSPFFTLLFSCSLPCFPFLFYGTLSFLFFCRSFTFRNSAPLSHVVLDLSVIDACATLFSRPSSLFSPRPSPDRPATHLPNLHDDQRWPRGPRRRWGDHSSHAALHFGHDTTLLGIPDRHELLPPSGQGAQAPRLHHQVGVCLHVFMCPRQMCRRV